MFKKLKQIWRILFPPKPQPSPKHPPRPQYDIGELIQRGEELKKIHHDETAVTNNVCPSCRASGGKPVTCAKCGRIGCEYCMTFDPSERKYFCEQCW